MPDPGSGFIPFGGDEGCRVPSRKDRAGDTQPLPTPNALTDIQTRVIRDLEDRRELGRERYGDSLRPFNGRSAMIDLYEELLDAACYAKQWIIENEMKDVEGL